jgi:2-polyprenyl-3-methyl-5-hydroxy-6-metoxy-1,4-benzoquinol methylase
MTLEEFYSRLTPYYHLIHTDWHRSIEEQAAVLDAIIRENWGNDVSSILDVSCGIGTQALGLAKLGYQVTASDLSREEIERAKQEAEERGLEISFSVADMREAFIHHRRQFDIVISCDNAVPHLLNDNDILTAFRQFYQCTLHGGGCLISVRDYENETLEGQTWKSHGIREEKDVRYLIFQVWDFHGPTYDLSLYVVEDRGEAECTTHVMRSQYYAIGIKKLIRLMAEAGFTDVRRIDNQFFQPIIIGTRN